MVYTFARVGAAVSMKVEDYFVQERRGWVRLHEKGGKEHEMPAHHKLGFSLEVPLRDLAMCKPRNSLRQIQPSYPLTTLLARPSRFIFAREGVWQRTGVAAYLVACPVTVLSFKKVTNAAT